MEANARYTLVGAMVLAVTVLLALGMFWVAGKADAIAYRHYTIYFSQQSMDGLDVDSAVKMRGIKVGSVSKYEFVSKPAEAVQVVIRVDENTPIRQGAEAYVKRNVVTGLATIEIANPQDGAPLLEETPKGERYPVIAEGSSELDKVAIAVSQMAENGAQVLEKMNTLLSDENQERISTTLANLKELSDHLASNKQTLEAAVQGMKDASDEFRFAGASIAQAATRAEESIQGVGKNAQTALKEAAVAMESLRKETLVISAKLQSLSETGSLELTAMSRDVRTGADAITNAGHKLSNPKALLLGPGKQQLGPGEKR
ncbi:MAG: MCE family protein [Hydrogenophilaceae bacterium]|nr:MCE family protein [Hydrogenophilaceae bacterium]